MSSGVLPRTGDDASDDAAFGALQRPSVVLPGSLASDATTAPRGGAVWGGVVILDHYIT